MKRPVLLFILFLGVATVNAQVKKVQAKQAARSSPKPAQKKIADASADTVISLFSTSINAAKASPFVSPTARQFRVSDPTVIAMGERAKGNEIFVSTSGIVGMPKRAYGFANGHILLRSTVATSSGSTGGTSSVGSGGSLSGMGSSGAFIGMNGKSPYAGQAMWGNARGLILDTTIKH